MTATATAPCFERTTEPPTPEQKPYRPLGAAEELFRCRAGECLIEGPAGTGKTRAVLEKAFIAATKYPGCRILMVRKTRESMTESVLVTWERDVVPTGHPILSGPQRRMRQAYSFPNGSSVVLGGLDKPDKVMSTEYDVVCAFEATELQEDDWEKLLTRLRNGIMPYQQGICDCNPGPPSHWLNKRADSRMVRLLSRHEDNPKVTPEYLERLDQLTGVRFLRLRKGLWAAAEGMVYDEWDAAVHLIDRFTPPASWRRIRAIDFGHTNPFVCQWWALDSDDRMYLYREMYQTKLLITDAAQRIVELSKCINEDGEIVDETIEATICDHDAGERAVLHRFGIPTIAAYKPVATGIEQVKRRLRDAGDGKPRLFLMRDCLVDRDPLLVEARKPVCTADEIEGYVYADVRDGKPIKEEPVKIDDHGMDDLRYAVCYCDPVTGGVEFHVVNPDGEPEWQGEWRHPENEAMWE